MLAFDRKARGQRLMRARTKLVFPCRARLLKHSAFERVYKQGRRLFSANVTLFVRLQELGESSGVAQAKAAAEVPAGPRVGFTVSRAFGGAVERNRLKRRLREAVRLNLPRLKAAVDVVINPKRSASAADFAALASEIGRAFTQIEHQAERPGSATDGTRKESTPEGRPMNRGRRTP